MKTTRTPSLQQSLSMVARVDPKFSPVWEGRSSEEQAALARYFLPHRSGWETLQPTRPRIVKWYCPFAHQAHFPSGHRYSINVSTGCAHGCVYCYAAGYEPESAACKRDFETLLQKDLDDLERFDVPPALLHLSNSTHPFQPLERTSRHTKYTLERLCHHRDRFMTITILTKAPLMAVEDGYVDLFRQLMVLPKTHPFIEEFQRCGIPAFQIEVSLAFWWEGARQFYDPGAPPVEERVDGILALREAGIPVVLRIDPLFPRNPIRGKDLADFGLPDAQPLEDLECLVKLAADVGALHVVYSVAKVVRPRGRSLAAAMRNLKRAYEHLADTSRLPWRGGSWRLPSPIANEHVLQPFLKTCSRHKMQAMHCMQNLIGTF